AAGVPGSSIGSSSPGGVTSAIAAGASRGAGATDSAASVSGVASETAAVPSSASGASQSNESSGSAGSATSPETSKATQTVDPAAIFTSPIVPPGSYSTSYSRTLTVINGATAVVDFVVLYTNVC
ncbi:hypothetical protein OY671_004355, partial [Metschnikowia pulcherrima]